MKPRFIKFHFNTNSGDYVDKNFGKYTLSEMPAIASRRDET
ncbi:hypothetical protein [Archaeoglobus fulgidus]|nr:hypothetical protein [Archaeoglobus fulgidus]